MARGAGGQAADPRLVTPGRATVDRAADVLRQPVLVGLLTSAKHEAAELLRRALPEGWSLVTSEGDADQPHFAERLPEIDYIVSAVMPFRRQHAERASRLKLLHKLGVGYNELDLAALGERGVKVAVCPIGVSDAVPEHTLALTLAAMKCIPVLDGAMRTNEWPASYRTRIRSLAGRRVGIVGFGRIGRPTAALFLAFGCSVEVFSRTRPASLPAPLDGFHERGVLSFTDDIEGLFDRCSVVSLHAPLTEATRNLVTEGMLEKLGPEGVFINTARGALVDEQALARTLADGRLGCAGLDVFREEAPDPCLLACANAVLSPHVGGGGSDVIARKVAFIVRNLTDFHATGLARELVLA